MQLVAIMADSANNEVLEMADFVKVAVARDRDEGHEVTKIWRFRKSCLTEYTLAEVEDDIVGYFPEISSKKLGTSLKYYDSLVKKKLFIENDGDLRVSLVPGTDHCMYVYVQFHTDLFYNHLAKLLSR